MKLIIGLGNPGKKYDGTRHNVGFMILDELSKASKNKWVEGKGPFLVSKKAIEGSETFLAKPAVFMNESGRAVQWILEEFNVSPNDSLIVLDEVNLPLGKIRFRSQGTAGGHNGLKSVIESLGTENIPRLRIGVGTGDLSGRDLTDFVLGSFSPEEMEILRTQIELAEDACREWVRSGDKVVMDRFNRD